MDRIQHANLKLAPKKCSFLKRKVIFVGHIVSAAGVEIDPDKTEKGREERTERMVLGKRTDECF